MALRTEPSARIDEGMTASPLLSLRIPDRADADSSAVGAISLDRFRGHGRVLPSLFDVQVAVGETVKVNP